MADQSQGPNGSLRRLRLATGVVLTTVMTFMLLAEAFAGAFPGVRPDYKIEPIIFGTVSGTLLLIIGIEVGNRWPWGGPK